MQIKVTEADLTNGTLGACIACGKMTNGVEPDARGYECEYCGAHKVYGLEELLLMDMLDIVGEEE